MGLKCKRFVEGNECLDRMREKAASNTLMGRSVKSSNHTAHLIPLKGARGKAVQTLSDYRATTHYLS